MDQRVLKHLFLPRKLSNKWTDSDDLAEFECVHWFNNFINSMDRNLIEQQSKNISTGLEIVKLSVDFFYNCILGAGTPSGLESKNVSKPEPPSVLYLQDTIKQWFIKHQFPLVMYIAQSNCYLVIYKDLQLQQQQVNPLVRVSVIPIYPPFEKTFTIEHLKAKISMPMVNYLVHIDQVLEVVFLENLVFLRDLAQPLPISCYKVYKSGGETIELKYPPKQNAITEWLMSNVTVGPAPSTETFYKSVSTLVYNDNRPWKRSPMWIGLKATIQFILSLYTTPTEYKMIYKLIMLNFYSHVIQRVHTNEAKHESFSDQHERLLKLANRMQKLEATRGTVPDQGQFYTISMNSCSNVIKTVSQDNYTQWETQCKLDHDSNQLSQHIDNIFSVKFANSVNHKFPNLVEYIKRITEEYAKSVVRPDHLKHPPHVFTLQWDPQSRGDKIPYLLTSITGWFINFLNKKLTLQMDKSMFLHCFEKVVLSVLWPQRKSLYSSNNTANALIYLLKNYSVAGMELYKNNPKLYSKMVLTCLVLVALVDRVPLEKHSKDQASLYYEYPPYVNISSLRRLLLEYRYEYQVLEQVELYFSERYRNCDSKLDIYSISSEGFACRWAKAYLQNQLLTRQIEDGKGKESKLLELNTRKSVASKRINTIENELQEVNQLTKQSRARYIHLTGELNRLKKDVILVFEEALPSDDTDQNIVIFDQFIPDDYVYIMDSFAILSTLFASPTSIKFQEFWSSKSNTAVRHVKLYSLTKSFINSHYRSDKLMTVLPNDVIKPCGRKVTGFCIEEGKVDIPSLNQWDLSIHSFEIEKTIQWMIQEDEVDENTVMAKQYMCPTKIMNPDQFVDFGLMRAGGNLQFRNIARALEGQRLDFNQLETYQLIQQMIYQVGPTIQLSTDVTMDGHSSSQWKQRPWKIDIDDSSVKLVITRSIVKHLPSISTNYDSRYILLTYIKLLIYMANISSNEINATEIKQALIMCRDIAQNWMKILKQLIADVLKNNSEKESKILKTNLVYACICSLLTYDTYIQENITPKATIDYIRSMVYLNSSTIMSTNGQPMLSNESDNIPTFQHLLKDCQRISLNRYQIINHFILTDTTDGNILTQFVNEFWGGTPVGSKFSQWEKYTEDGNNWWYNKFTRPDDKQSLFIQLNTQTGQFLIDGSPISRLPTEIEQSPAYQRIFGYSILEVQSNGYQRWKTSHPHYGRYYEFFTQKSKNGLVVILEEILETSSVKLLLPNTKFQLPKAFIENYSHWLDIKNNIIEFRPISFVEYNQHHNYQYNIATGEIQSTENLNVKLMDIHSHEFKSIDSLFKRIEEATNIHVFIHQDNGDIKIHLPRYSLDFLLNYKDHTINCSQYPGFFISPNQYTGTLIGLHSTLVLSHIGDTTFRKLLVPNSALSLIKGTRGKKSAETVNHHQQTKSDINKLRNPPLFCYDIDDEFSLLRSNDILPQLFLTYLHGVTSSTLPDPFTGITGAESAIQALKHYQSNIPFTEECLEMLNDIGELSPKRSSYPPGMANPVLQYAKFNKFMHPSISGESFKLLSNHIIQTNNEISFLYAKNVKEKKEQADEEKVKMENNLTLLEVHYQRSVCNLSPLATIEVGCLSSRKHVIFTQYPIAPYSSEIQTLSNKFENTVDTLPQRYLKDWLLNRENGSLHGPPSIGSEPIEKVSDLPVNILPRPMWFTLYTLAKDVVDFRLSRQKFKYFCTFMQWHWLNSNHKGAVTPKHYFECLIQLSRCSKLLSAPHHTVWVHPLDTCNHGAILDKIKKGTIFKNTHTKIEIQQFQNNLFNIFTNNACWKMYAFGVAPIVAIPPLNEHACIKHELNGNLKNLIETYIANRDLKLFALEMDTILEIRFFEEEIPLTPLALVKHLEYPSFKSDYKVESVRTKRYTEVPYPNYFSNLWETGYDVNIENVFASCLVTLTTKSEISSRCSVFLENIPNRDKLMGDYIYKDLQSSLSTLVEKFKDQKQHDLTENHQTQLITIGKYIIQLSNEIWSLILQSFSSTNQVDNVFKMVGLLNETSKINIYNYFKSEIDEQSSDDFSPLFKCIGAYILLKSYLAKVKRCLSRSREDVIKELETSRMNRNWKPKDYPEWLLFELEQDIMIRDIQSKIAIDLINSQVNICTQLQMGEGKTSVILPLMCLALSRKRMVVRVNVLPSLLETSRDDIIRRMGGILNRKLYIFPYQRDRDYLAVQSVQTLLFQLEECKSHNGIILSTPEYNLSFLLKWKLKFEDESKNMKPIIDWYNQYIFDILDESDELLSHKYQLLYPIGYKLPLDGGNQRWSIIQNICLTLKKYAPVLIQGLHMSVEYNSKYPSAFPVFTILDQAQGKLLVNRLLEVIIDQKLLDSEKKAILIEMASKEKYNHSHFEKLLKLNDSNFKYLALMYRGLFLYGVLLHSLQKIPTKDYGFASTTRTRLAVPYRAKDTPSERAEYGHPDIALVLTHFAYYNQGLTYEQFVQVIEYLTIKEKHQAKAIYTSWVEEEVTVPDHYKSITCIAISNSSLMKALYQIFRFNMLVINFYLSSLVLPYETKAYPEKLFANAWDITAHKKYPTTGFSGTNDTSCLLPLTIEQKDLKELKYTNFEVIKYILSQSNNDQVEMVNKDTIFNQLITNKHKPRVLIDTGALMIGKSNLQVAKDWLKQSDPTLIDGALYFDESNVLSAIDRSGRKYTFYLSPFVQQLDRVVVYLDDYHTRGVDIKFPIGTHACVTVGAQLTKEKLLQGILRLRKFGRGQTVSFFVSDQLSIYLNNTLPTVEMILNFVINNTIQSITNAFQSWSLQGIMYTRTSSASQLFSRYPKIFRSLSTFPEILKLEDMYSHDYFKSNLSVVIDTSVAASDQQFAKCIESLNDPIIKNMLLRENSRLLKQITKKAQELVSDVEVYSNMMDEEQEREFEIEEEIERETQLPGQKHPLEPEMTANLMEMVKDSTVPLDPKWIPHISVLYQQTSLSKCFESQAWSTSIRVSNDFLNTIRRKPTLAIDQFIKIPNFLLFIWSQVPQAIFISQYEANILLPIITATPLDDVTCSMHQLAPQLDKQQDNLFQTLHTPLPQYVQSLNEQSLSLLHNIANQLSILIGSKYFPSHQLSNIYSILGILELDNKSLQYLINKYPKTVASTGFVKDKLTKPQEIPDIIWAKATKSKFKLDPNEFIQNNLTLRRVHSIMYSDIESIFKLNQLK
ncbi:hypothetical protein DLAC_06549 [Tieghemostelium lacteum]|uniref:ubiquitinyl hydrolase 1 n=1 Tax=Tieghemostelium lacteum TaxID=361077 RepID=A0A151ZF18_TIELA|nr:hypothetical protein DLAC_06549 [Tieghemostelium lacteum]|eukprot:KYQ92558.1 hypothetical protein DLAC_06549 [Tieghemostelium lacteum]